MKRKDCTEKGCDGKLKIVGKNHNDNGYMCEICKTFMSDTNIQEGK